MDTLFEDEDNYRFLTECNTRWKGVKFVTLRDGRTPLQVADDRRIISNSRTAPCTYTLKIKLFLDYCKKWQSAGFQAVVILGMDWKERHRMDAPTKNYGERGILVEYPLLWKPYETDMFATMRGWGIEPPRMYRMGYSHANCGGRCVKQGQGDWLRTLTNFPERFEEVSQWEQSARERLGDYAMLKSGGNPLTLDDLKKRRGAETEMPLFEFAGIEDDMTYCFCNAGDPGPTG